MSELGNYPEGIPIRGEKHEQEKRRLNIFVRILLFLLGIALYQRIKKRLVNRNK